MTMASSPAPTQLMVTISEEGTAMRIIPRAGVFALSIAIASSGCGSGPRGATAATAAQAPVPSGMIADPGFPTDNRACEGIACGYVFGVAGTQEVFQNFTAPFVISADSDGACSQGGCAVCGGGLGTPAIYLAMIRANTTFGDLPDQTYVAEMCTNPNHLTLVSPSGGPFFELKACRINGVDPEKCPNGGQYTSCGCTPAANIKCKPCAAFPSEREGRPAYIPPFGEIDATAHNPITDEVSDLLKHHDDFDWNVANSLQWTYGPTCRAKNVYCSADDQCCEHHCELTEFGWGKCTPPEQ